MKINRRKLSLLILTLITVILISFGSVYGETEEDRVLVRRKGAGPLDMISITREEYERDYLSPYSLMSLDDEEYIVEPDYIRYTQNALDIVATWDEEQTWGRNRLGVQTLIDRVKDINDEVIVAVIDSGVDMNHELFEGRLVKGENIIADFKDTQDIYGHGTQETRTERLPPSLPKNTIIPSRIY